MNEPYKDIIVTLIILHIIYWVLIARKEKFTKPKRSEASRSKVIHSLLHYGGYILAWPVLIESSFLATRFIPQNEVSQSIGTILAAIGVGLAIWARSILGAYWSSAVTIKEGHRLIMSGPYRFVRNPIYTGDVITVLGMALALGEVRGLLGLALIVAYAVLKGRMEERFLLAEFGDEFVSYQHKVRFLIPFVF